MEKNPGNTLKIENLKFHSMEKAELLQKLEVDENTGLKQSEVQKRLSQFGKNELQQEEKESLFEKLLEQFDDPMVKLLLLAAVISFFISYYSSSENSKTSDLPIWVEPFVIFLILIANGLIALYQDYNAEKSVEMLKNLQSKSCSVLRNGDWELIDSTVIVPGDIVKLSMGDVVSADLRIILINSFNLRINQSILSGESVGVDKVETKVNDSKNVFDYGNMLFSGTTVLFGEVISVVVKTGEKTELGKIKIEMEKARKDTKNKLSPLKIQLNNFGEFLAWSICAICLLIWLISFPNFFDKVHGGWFLGALYYFKQAVALGVAAIPEGLPAVITTCLSLGTRRMIVRKALVRKLPVVETLGCTTVICSDKTGTLTKNEMVVSKFGLMDVNNKMVYSNCIGGEPYSPEGNFEINNALVKKSLNLNLFSLTCLKNSQSKILKKNDKYVCIGNPTEGALLSLGGKLNKQEISVMPNCSKLFTNHFTSFRKMMSVVVRDKSKNENFLLLKGAAEMVIQNCTSFLNSNNEIIQMTDEIKNNLQLDLKKLAKHGLRLIAMSYKSGDKLGIVNNLLTKEDKMNPAYRFLMNQDNLSGIESETIFLGIACIKDPVKEEVENSIKLAYKAGIAVMMITGDNQGTALAIGKELTLIPENVELEDKNKTVYIGEDLDKFSDVELSKVLKSAIDIKRGLIFARTNPVHKRRIVKLLTDMDEIVAMTGDGVNDAPALTQASIGIAMGIHGTDVAKEASDLILLDDNFATIITAIEEGRSIYANMKAFIRYMISSNIGEVISIFLTSLIGIPEGFNSIQLLWVNLVTDGLPATALSFNKPDPDTMVRPPRTKNDKIVDSWVFTRYMIVGLYVGFATVGIFVYYYCFYGWANHTHSIISFSQLRNWSKCGEWSDVNFINFESDACDYFFIGKKKASTLSLTVLVMIEMWNALNAMSEDQGMLTIGIFNNMWLWYAIISSTILHCFILYIPVFSSLFSTTPLDFFDWILVMVFTIPVIFIEEVLKYFSRQRNEKKRALEQKRRKKED